MVSDMLRYDLMLLIAAAIRRNLTTMSKQQALEEVRALGFGELVCTPDNDYIRQYILTFQPGQRKQAGVSTRVVRDRIRATRSRDLG